MKTLTATADPARREILARLRNREPPAGAVVEALGLPQPNVSKPLKALHEAGPAPIRATGPRRVYSLDTAPLAEIDQWLASYRAFWSKRLDALGDHLSRSD